MEFETGSSETFSPWILIPDAILLMIFHYLPAKDVLSAGATCWRWREISLDELLWKHIFFRRYGITSNPPISPGKHSWYEEYKRLCYHTPLVCSEVLKAHENEVLHVSFSHDGTMFATSSKDGFILVWDSDFPVKLKYSYDMKEFSWKCTQFSQFNKSNTLLLVSGVLFGTANSTSGEIAVFSLQGEFQLLCRYGNKPYDIFGTWFSDTHLLSGDLYWLAYLVSTTGLWINKATQDTSSFERNPILNQLFRFYNTNGSSVRTIMVAKIPPNECNKMPMECVDESDEWEQLAGDSDYDEDDVISQSEKLLIFTTGSKTYSPHQIGIKRIKKVKLPLPGANHENGSPSTDKFSRFPLVGPQYAVGAPSTDKFDEVDHLIDMEGHIIGMALSPDNRYLYVNSRPWPDEYVISNPLIPPPIAQEIEIHVIDLRNFSKLDKCFKSHKAYTTNNLCFFIFLDVSDELVASGAEDKHGYIWERWYGMCFAKLPHREVVNSVAFNPVDQGMLVSTSDDYEIKVWRSKSFLDKTIGLAERCKLSPAIPPKKCFPRHSNQMCRERM